VWRLACPCLFYWFSSSRLYIFLKIPPWFSDSSMQVWWTLYLLVQYLKHIHLFRMGQVVFERFGLLLCIGIVWAFAAILTAAGAYNNVRPQTKLSCRTDHSFPISSAPWYVQIWGLSLHMESLLPFSESSISDAIFGFCFQSRVKIPYPFQWGTPIFRASHVFGMIGAALVSSAEV